ncbi:MAG: hypothetical protein IJZ36_01045 [Bacilli bacterium]|nr:hypothetical protein [Bacilli bacterium]
MKFLDKIFNKNKLTCNEELNILDIDDNIFYSIDGYISLYIKVNPIPFEYLNQVDKLRIVKKIISELAGEREIIKIIVMSLPISTKEINDFLNVKRNKTKNAFKRRKLLEEIEEINRISYKGEMIEKQVIIQLFQKESKGAIQILEKRGKEFVLKLQNAGLSSYILDKHEILQFFNSFLNMKFRKEKIDNVWSVENE